MRKILFFDHTSILSGGERSLLDILTHLDQHRFKSILVIPQKGPLYAKARKVGAEVIILPICERLLKKRREEVSFFSIFDMIEFLKASFRLKCIVKTEHPHVIHTNSQKAHLLSIIPSLITNTPLVWQFRDILKQRFLKKVVCGAGIIFTRRIIAISDAVKSQFKMFNSVPDKVVRIYNGVELPRSGFNRCRKRNIHIGQIGQIARWKGQKYFIEAARLLKKNENLLFYIIGDVLFWDEEYKNELLNSVKKYNLEKRVIFTGQMDDIGKLIEKLDIVVHPSVEPEPFGRVLIEAMSRGKPVIVSRIGAVPEIVTDGKTGLLVPPGNSVAIKEAIENLIRDKRLYRYLSRNGPKVVAERFQISETVKKIEHLYADIL